jgi:hypothetical protein
MVLTDSLNRIVTFTPEPIMTTVQHMTHIFVEITKTDKRKVEFDKDTVTGEEIKLAAGVPLDSDLAQRVHGKLELVTNDKTVAIKNGDQFVALPPGTIS